MSNLLQGKLLKTPSKEEIRDHSITSYKNWLTNTYQKKFNSYNELWEWSTTETADFWKSILEYGEIQISSPYTEILTKDDMPHVQWFKNATLNYTQQIFSKITTAKPAIIFKSEHKETVEISWSELTEQVAAVAAMLRHKGVKKGMRVVALMPNIPETIVAFLATASIGAIWSVCSPDFGGGSIIDRFKQIEPTVLFTIDGYQYNGQVYSKRKVIDQIIEEIPSIEHSIVINYMGLFDASALKNAENWAEILESFSNHPLEYEQVEFSHPLWVLYSSGTTGLPKPIVHSQGSILLDQIKTLKIESNASEKDRVFWFTTTGWMMWNFLVGGLSTRSTVILYDGSPSYPNLSVLWEYAEEVNVTIFGTSAAFLDVCMKHDFRPNEHVKLKELKTILVTASPLSANAFEWAYKHIKEDMYLITTSGGTDVCALFVGGTSSMPVRAGIIPARGLGVRVEAFDEAGNSVKNKVGELVITKPMPTMPIYFWGDDDFSRYYESYFDTYPNIWKHGDWIQFNDDGSSVIFGRSDSTINRSGLRMGTSEIYKIIETIPEIMDSLVIDLEYHDQPSYMPLFIVLRQGETLDDFLIQKIKVAIKKDLSPRFVPDAVLEVKDIPKTLNGKKLEIPIRKILLGFELEKTINRDAMSNPESLDFFVEYQLSLQE